MSFHPPTPERCRGRCRGTSREVVCRRDAKALDIHGKRRERLALGCERLEHALLARSLGFGEHELRPGDSPRREEFSDDHSAIRFCMVRRKLDCHRRPQSLPSEEQASRVHGKRSGIVIGMTALVGVREHAAEVQLRERSRDPVSELREVERGLLVGYAERVQLRFADSGERERGDGFGAPRSRVVLARGKLRRAPPFSGAWRAIEKPSCGSCRRTAGAGARNEIQL
jgi:hypothetical protein